VRRRLILVGALAVVVLVGGGLLIASQGSDDAVDTVDAAGLAARTTSAGEVDVEIRPRRIDDGGAVFAITLDTHSVELDMDLTEATLEVAGAAWAVAGWSGDGPSGHHREGELRFDPAGPASGTARLVLAGFDEPVEASWDLGS